MLDLWIGFASTVERVCPGQGHVDVRRGLGGLQERRSADLALNVHGLLVLRAGDMSSQRTISQRQSVRDCPTYDFELGLGRLRVLLVALTLLLCLGSLVSHQC